MKKSTFAVLFLAATVSAPIEARTPQTDVARPSAVLMTAGVKSGYIQDTDRSDRTLKLKLPEGRVETFQVGSEVENFDDLAKGDYVKIRYFESMVSHLEEKGTMPQQDINTEVEMSAARKDQPAKRTVRSTRIAATVDSVNQDDGTMVLKYSDGNRRTLKIQENAGLFRTVEPGDEVVVQVTESYAISVERG